MLAAIAASGAVLLVSTDRDDAGMQIAAELTAAIAGGYGADCIAPWLPEADGLYEEERMELFIDDLSAAP